MEDARVMKSRNLAIDLWAGAVAERSLLDPFALYSLPVLEALMAVQCSAELHVKPPNEESRGEVGSMAPLNRRTRAW
jgi:hypothetical protein